MSEQATVPDVSGEIRLKEARKNAALLLQAGLTVEEVQKHLIDKGLDPADVAKVVKSRAALNLMKTMEPSRSSPAKSGQKDMIVGAVWCLGGIVVTAVTYRAALAGGTYLVAWGAIVFGAIQFARGLLRAMRG